VVVEVEDAEMIAAAVESRMESRTNVPGILGQLFWVQRESASMMRHVLSRRSSTKPRTGLPPELIEEVDGKREKRFSKKKLD